jgi:maleylpyruvate isomerase
VTADPLALTDELILADARLQATIAGLSEEALGEPSLLPGWTRGHVLAHIARNADALNNLLTWARTGIETLPYATPTTRVDDIEAGANGTLMEHIDDIRTSAAQFAEAAADMPVDAWGMVLGKQGSAVRVVWRRLREVEVHHVDLDAGYTPADWPEAFTHRLLHELVHDRPRSDGTLPVVAVHVDGLAHPLQLGTGTPAVTVSGPGHTLAAWMSGRSDGSSLVVSPTGPLPTLSDWM